MDDARRPPASGISRRGLLISAGGVVLAGLTVGAARPSVARAAGAIPTFAERSGFVLGDRQATAAQLDRYVQDVAAASPRVTTGLLRPSSVRGKPLRYAVVSHPDNLARLDEIERKTRALRLKPPAAAVAAAHARDEPAFVVVAANVHGNEPSGADAAVRLLYELAARDDAANLARLRALVVVIVPVQNPDGREAGLRVNANQFDLNRDWFAFTQPETVGKIALYSRFPPVLGIDSHEQFFSPPDTFFFPPDNDPVHHEASRAGLKASNEVVTPAIERSFAANGFRAGEHYGIYDVFYPGYGDIAPNHAFGAAGVLFEQENAEVYTNKVARQFAAIEASVDAVAAAKVRLLTDWAAQWPEATAQGEAGTLQPNIRQNPENPAPRPVPDERIYAYALRTTVHAADVAHLVDRLRAFDVQIHVTRREVRTTRLRPFGTAAFGPATLPAGTVIVTCAQPLKHWVHILLADDPHPAVDYFYDVAGWSNPAMMGLQGGAIGEPLPPLLRRPRRTEAQKRRKVPIAPPTLRAVDRAAELQTTPAASGAYRFALDGALAQAAAFALIADSVAVRRLPGGDAFVQAGARSAVLDAGRAFGVQVTGAIGVPGDATPVRRPRVALIRDLGADLTSVLFATSAGFAGWLLRDRFGLAVTSMTTAEVDLGALESGAFDAVVVPDGLSTVIPAGVPNVSLALPGGGLTPLGLSSIARFVAGGGTFLGWRNQGIAVAVAAGIAGSLRTVPAPSGYTVPGGPIGIDLQSDDPAVRGLGGSAFAFNVADPILQGGGTTIARYPDALVSLAHAEGVEALRGTVAGTSVAVGAGRAYVFSFDPAYRGFVEGTQRIVGGALLAARGVEGRSRGADPRPVDLARAAGLRAPVRQRTVRVRPADEAALRAALAACGGPAGVAVEAVRGGVQVRAIDDDPLAGHPASWQRRLVGELTKRGVAPTLVVG